MNNRYTLPIAFAVAVHTSLMFGFRHSSVVAAPLVASLAKLPDKVIELKPLEDPPEPDKNEVEAKGAPTDDTARSPEPEDSRLDKAIFEIAPPVVTRIHSDSPIFDPQPPGISTGDPRAIGGPRIISAAGLDKAPHAQVQATPDYPFAAKREGLNGEVVVEFLVDETGRVSNPSIVRSSNSMFDEPSLRAVLKWRFEPGRRDGRVVRFRMAVPVVFRLNND